MMTRNCGLAKHGLFVHLQFAANTLFSLQLRGFGVCTVPALKAALPLSFAASAYRYQECFIGKPRYDGMLREIGAGTCSLLLILLC